ncbi:MAG: VCBS repeat-containing protein [Candidatus Aminicenantes bacterium]|nr:VCBS repeat-containing protein [Candidatus Aminicenantes bacterium]
MSITETTQVEEVETRRNPESRISLWVLLPILLTLGLAQAAEFKIVHEGFESFSKGSFEHAGQDIYVSRKGRVQLIRRWDLNNDGYYDLPFASTHNVMVGSIDALGYLQTNRGYRSVLSPLHRSLALYDLWLQEEKSRSSTLRLPADRPSAVLFSDVDQDGHADVVFASSGLGDTPFSDSLIYWGSESGYRRGSRTALPTAGARDVAVGDLNRDGRQDVVFANRPGPGRRNPGSYIYWGSTDFYGERHRTALPTDGAVGCRIADLDADGHPDLIFATHGQEGGLEVYWGRETGPDPESPSRFPIPGLVALETAATADRGTMLAALSQKELRLFAFSSRQPVLQTTVDRGGARVRLADLDRDGRLEIVLAGGNTSAVIWGRDGSETPIPTLNARDAAVSDLNGDGFPELIFANYSEGVYGNLDVSSYVFWGSVHGYADARRTDLQTFGAAAVAVGDLNGDNRKDLLFGNTGSGISGGKDEFVYVYWGRPHRGYSPAFVSRYPCVMAMGIAMVDLDDDDHAELLVANSGRHYSGLPGASYLYWGAPGGPAVEKRHEFDLNENGSWEIADLNRDGYLDIVGFDFDTLFLAWGGPRKFSDPGRQIRIPDVARMGQNCRLLDFDRDGWLDILTADISSRYSKILLGGPDGYSSGRVQRLEEPGIGNAEVADLDADGWLDLVLLRPYSRDDGVNRADSWIKVYHGNERGLEARPRFDFPTVGAIDVLASDLNGDGALDLAVSQYQSRSHRKLPVLLFWNDGRGGFSGRRRTDLPGESPSALMAADMDYDGHTDLLVMNHKLSVGEDNHSVESYLYWGAQDGFSVGNRSYLPAPGPHFLQNVDVGNLATRRPEASYTSPALDLSTWPGEIKLTCEAETPRGSRIQLLARFASDRGGLEAAAWKPVPESGRVSRGEEDSWLQYRATLIAGMGYASPYLTRVTIRAD